MAEISPIDVQKALSGVDYPCDRDQLAKRATDNGADKRLVERIRKLDTKTFQNPAEVSKALFKHA
ncbi:DUF2795 domain-containing protein [Peterkaempfera bronchialis]|uniref:DUF2795 domain-containing protein n=1 Tax=Peterkaempfera bronchialis TaxID=2126346 RepID=A0A345T3L3_9ACTN|nr:DUF2795 domain-containing protein [Peterkaempfera bronchialis]AXI80568.1 DUF2795 domain-containing protein [Peterkaempfera bronchialis]